MKKLLTHAALCAVICVTTTQVAFSAPISTASQLAATANTNAITALAVPDQALAAAWLQRADVQQQLIHYGVSPAEAQARLANLSDQDLARVTAQIDQAPAGSSPLALVGIVFIVLIILEVIGVIDIFKKV